MRMEISRRRFLSTSGAAVTGLVIGFHLPTSSARAQQMPTPPPWVVDRELINAYMTFNEDGTVSIVSAAAEMGQGSLSVLPMLIAEELELEIDQVIIEQAPINPDAFRNREFNSQITVGSVAAIWAYEPLRQLGANTRELMRNAAAASWDVPVSETVARAGAVLHEPSGRSAAYYELGETASTLEIPTDVPLKPASEWRIIGTPFKRWDTPAKSNGTAGYGIDALPEGLLVGTVAMCPVFGGTLASVDPAPALAVEGVRDVVTTDDGVIVVATNYWTAKKGLDALQPEWDRGPVAALNSADLREEYLALLEQPGNEAINEGDVAAAKDAAATVISATYEAPYWAHATMEPPSATAHYDDGRVEYWLGTQGPEGLRNTTVEAFPEVSPENVVLHNQYLGGGFGRGASTTAALQATLASKQTGAPVKVIWSREADLARGKFRPMSVCAMEGYLGEDGALTGFKGRIAVQNTLAGLLDADPSMLRFDPFATEGLITEDYKWASLQFETHSPNPGIPIGFYRGVGYIHNVFFRESFVDELAHAAGRDPLEVRLGLASHDERGLAVLNTLAERSNWGSPAAGNAQGMAFSYSDGSYVGKVFELSVDDNNAIKLHKITCVFDVGIALNPALVAHQMESSITWGLTSSMMSEILIENGETVQRNFHEYEMVQMRHMPPVELVMMPPAGEVGSAGECATQTTGPALTNAIFAATGQRIRTLPVRNHGFSLV